MKVASCKRCCRPILHCVCRPKRRCSKVVRVPFRQLVGVLNTINDQLIGINASVNSNVNSLSSLVSSTNANLNSNVANAVAALNASLSDTLRVSTNTIVSNMNTIEANHCSVHHSTLWTDFSVPCGGTKIYFENFSSPTTEKVVVRAGSFQPVQTPCRAVLIITQQDGHVIERLLPPNGSETTLQIDNYSNIAIRCDFGIGDPPDGYAECKGFIEVEEWFCICCSRRAA